MTDLVLPDLGEGLVEAEILEWRVGVGDRVVAGQPLVTVETDKAVVDVPSPRAGTVAALYGEPGDIVPVGTPLVTFGETVPDDAATVVGRVPGSPVAKAMPAVRDLARRLGVDLDGVTGSGPGGVVTSADVEVAAGTAAGPVEPLRGVRRAMAANMARAHRDVVPATVHDVAAVDEWSPLTDPTIRLVRAVGVAASVVPALNVEFLGPEQGRRIHDEVHVGVAVETEDGLFVPVLRDVADRDASDLRAGLDRLRSDVAARSIPAEELTGATITLSNFGMHGGLYATLVVIPPQVAIVGAGRLHDAVVVRAGTPVVRRSLPLSLTFDHRVVTGVEATRFLVALIDDLESPT
jgi:pyruvate dehydrogenase E2 component (dihydrolipoamide acetyltransferase)